MIRREDLDLLLPSAPAPRDSWSWATVTQASPLRVRLDGETTALDLTPDSLVSGVLTVGERVWCHVVGRRIVVSPVVERLPVLPDVQTQIGASTNVIDATAWSALPTPISVVVTSTRRLRVDVRLGAWLVKTSNVDIRVSFRATGATTYSESAPYWGGVLWSAADNAFDGQYFVTKALDLEVGTTTIDIRAYVNTGTANVNYPYLEVVPTMWLE